MIKALLYSILFFAVTASCSAPEPKMPVVESAMRSCLLAFQRNDVMSYIAVSAPVTRYMITLAAKGKKIDSALLQKLNADICIDLCGSFLANINQGIRAGMDWRNIRVVKFSSSVSQTTDGAKMGFAGIRIQEHKADIVVMDTLTGVRFDIAAAMEISNDSMPGRFDIEEIKMLNAPPKPIPAKEGIHVSVVNMDKDPKGAANPTKTSYAGKISKEEIVLTIGHKTEYGVTMMDGAMYRHPSLTDKKFLELSEKRPSGCLAYTDDMHRLWLLIEPEAPAKKLIGCRINGTNAEYFELVQQQ